MGYKASRALGVEGFLGWMLWLTDGANSPGLVCLDDDVGFALQHTYPPKPRYRGLICTQPS